MNEINNIVKQFTDLQHGDSWIGINFKEALHDVNSTTAAGKKQTIPILSGSW